MISVFAIPKAFVGHVGMIQRNAIRSWTRLAPDVEVIICGDDEGAAEVAEEVGAIHLPRIARNRFGTPRLDDAFRRALEVASRPFACYCNADIVLTSSLPRCLARLRLRRFLLTGRRHDIDIRTPLDFEGDWESRLELLVRERGSLRDAWGLDYFVFPAGDRVGRIPLPLVVGRAAWDNWFVDRACRLGVPVVDATERVLAVHQNHDYAHVAERSGPKWQGPESDEHRVRVGNRMRNLHQAAVFFVDRERGTLAPALRSTYLGARASAFQRTRPVLARLVRSWKLIYALGAIETVTLAIGALLRYGIHRRPRAVPAPVNAGPRRPSGWASGRRRRNEEG